MKKSLVLVAIIISLGCLSGCGNKSKVLECTMDNSQSGMKMDQTIKTTFKGKEVKSFSVNVDVEVDEQYKNYLDTIITSVESQFTNYNDKKGISVKTNKNDKGFVVTFEADLDKMDKETKEDLDMVDTKATYDEAKKEFEKEGYTCK